MFRYFYCFGFLYFPYNWYNYELSEIHLAWDSLDILPATDCCLSSFLENPQPLCFQRVPYSSLFFCTSYYMYLRPSTCIIYISALSYFLCLNLSGLHSEVLHQLCVLFTVPLPLFLSAARPTLRIFNSCHEHSFLHACPLLTFSRDSF